VRDKVIIPNQELLLSPRRLPTRNGIGWRACWPISWLPCEFSSSTSATVFCLVLYVNVYWRCGGQDSVVSTGSTVRGSTPVKWRLPVPVQTGPGTHATSYKMGTGSLPGVKRPGRGVKHPSPSSIEVKERVELYLYSPSVFSWQIKGWKLLLPACHKIKLEEFNTEGYSLAP
jgi:hypothetical protein